MGYKSLDKTKPKPKHKKGLWSPDEDQRLRNYILQHGHGCWSSVPINAGLHRNGKSCRLRWINYLRPGLKRGIFSSQEEDTIITLHRTLGNKWSQIAQQLPGRTDNEIKNFWHSHLKKKISRAKEVEGIEISAKTEITTSTPPLQQTESPAKSCNPSSSLDSSTTSSSSPDQSTDHNKSCLPKILFAEWLTLDNILNDHNNNNIHGHNNNSQDIELSYNNMDLHERSSRDEVTMLNQESCCNDDLFNGVEDFIYNSQLKFEDQTPETGLDDFFLPGDDINDDSFMSSNLMYM